jgi:hypothetical protein
MPVYPERFRDGMMRLGLLPLAEQSSTEFRRELGTADLGAFLTAPYPS